MNDRFTRIGLWLVGVVAAVWSFTALTDLARSCGITSTFTVPLAELTIRVAWGLPLTVDVLAVVMTRAWLRGDLPASAVAYAQRAAWGAIGASIIGNAYHGLKVGNWALDALIVSAVPAVVLGVIGHLTAIAGRTRTKPAASPEAAAPTTDPEPITWDETRAELDRLDDHGVNLMWETAPPTESRTDPDPVDPAAIDPPAVDPADRPGKAISRAADAATKHAAENGALPTLSQLEELAGVSRGTAVNAIKRVKATTNGHQL